MVDAKAAEATGDRLRRDSKPIVQGVKKGIALPEQGNEGKEAFTRFEVAGRFNGYTLVRAFPKTGRTHQIRVHVASAGHPLAYDPLYGRQAPLRFREFVVRTAETEQ